MWGGHVFKISLQFLTMLVTFVADSEQFELGSVGQCSNKHQQTAFEVHNQHRCNPREELVRLEVPSDGSVIQVLCDVMLVCVCDGSVIQVLCDMM